MINERRRFFRINDTIGVNYRILKESELNLQSDTDGNPVSTLGLLGSYDSQIQASLEHLNVKDPLMGGLLDVFNRKLNLIINQLQLESNLSERLAHKVQEVNISACGMAFTVDEKMDIGQKLGFDLILYPSDIHIFAQGDVIACEQADDSGQYYIRTSFQQMSQGDQELLIQHIVRRQGAILRLIREQQSPLKHQ